MKVSLEWYEISRAALVGVSRNVEAMRKGLQSARPIGESDWHIHILGACGEVAFAKATNRYWSGSVNTFKTGGDVGGHIQIRTRSRSHYDLIVRDNDNDDDIFVLVTGGPAEFDVKGYMRASDAKSEKYRANWGNYGEAYFVPQAELHPIDALVCEDPS